MKFFDIANIIIAIVAVVNYAHIGNKSAAIWAGIAAVNAINMTLRGWR